MKGIPATNNFQNNATDDIPMDDTNVNNMVNNNASDEEVLEANANLDDNKPLFPLNKDIPDSVTKSDDSDAPQSDDKPLFPRDTSASTNSLPPFGSPSSKRNSFGNAFGGAGLDDGFDDDFGGGFGSGLGGGFGGAGGASWGGGGNSQPMSREDRTKMIKKLYKEVLGREAQTRDINYYKYGTQTEDQIRTQLMKSDEHKETIKKGVKFAELQKELEEVKTRLQAAESKIRDADQEKDTLRQFLEQKNAEITRLRASNNSLTSSFVQPPVTNPNNYGYTATPASYNQMPRVPYVPPQTPAQASVQAVHPVNAQQPTYQTPTNVVSPTPMPTFTPKPAEYREDPSSPTYSPPPAQSLNNNTAPLVPPKRDIIDRITSIFF